MSNPLEGTNSSARIIVTETTIGNSNQQQHNAENVSVNSSEQVDCPIKSKRKRTKTSPAWNDFDEIEFPGGIKKAQCKFCKEKLSITGKGWSIGHLLRHMETFQPKKDAIGYPHKNNQYSNEKMREALATAIMMHELPFNIVDAQEKKCLKALLRSVGKISLTTDMWRSNHQVVEYMVITGHFIDAEWKLQKRVLSFVKVPTPRRGVDVADIIFKCLKSWGIDEMVFSISIDNASYNDSCLKTLKENISCDSRLVLDGALFHVRCCTHILNLLVQDGLKEIKDVIYNIRESVKYINHNYSRLKNFCVMVEQKHLKERKLVIDCPTRWNSTFDMLSCALKFKTVFASYKDKEPHYNYAPSNEDWDKVEKVCRLLYVFNLATHVISGSEYPTATLYLAEVVRVKDVIDKASEDEDHFMREMVAPMKIKFEKYWGNCNLLMAIASVLDPRCKFQMINVCFPLVFKTEEFSIANMNKVRTSLQQLYCEYSLNMKVTSSNEDSNTATNPSSSQKPKLVVHNGFQHWMSMVREKNF
ncbi:hypothetical protein Lal_00033570 [Lupinus albus]|nr:hypothetical protein Lal_00033570 [Lupinus albus]